MGNAQYKLIHADARAGLASVPDASVQCVVTSPPYWALRDYGTPGQIGHEATPAEYVAKLVEVFREIRRVLKPDGVVWLNLGDTYASKRKGGTGSGWAADESSYANQAQAFRPIAVDPGVREHNLVGIPWRVALALQADGWILRSDVIWHKPNAMPESVRSRPTKAHEYVFLLAKSASYFFDADAVRERPKTDRQAASGTGRKRYTQDGMGACPSGSVSTHPKGRNVRTVWEIATRPFRGGHFATFPEELVRRCILAGSGPGDTVLDPFSGAATTGVVALAHGRSYVGVEISAEYIALAHDRIRERHPDKAAHVCRAATWRKTRRRAHRTSRRANTEKG